MSGIFVNVDRGVTDDMTTWGYYTLDDDTQAWTRHIAVDIEIDGVSVADARAMLAEAADGVTDAVVEIETDEYYGSINVKFGVKGTRPATGRESVLATQAKQKAESNAYMKRRQEVEQFRQRFPNLKIVGDI